MNAVIWIAVIVAIYFVLKQFDHKKEKNQSHNNQQTKLMCLLNCSTLTQPPSQIVNAHIIVATVHK